MPANRNALIRYKTIDQCLRNRRRRWTLDDLIEKVGDALYEYEGMKKGISRRTIQADIQLMRSDKLGYNAPIVILEKKYYTYEDTDYSITNLPLTDSDFERMSEAVEVLRQFKGFSHFQELSAVVQKLEGHIYASSHDQKVVIDFEKNEQLKGLEHLTTIYEAITHEYPLELIYRSFKARKPSSMIFHPWWLKEFKNRWFVVGVKDDKKGEFLTLALDRIEELKPATKKRYRANNTGITPEEFYKHVIGVTVLGMQRPVKVHILIGHVNAPYVLTKPLHHTQKIIEKNNDGVVIEICVQHNMELEKEILGFGDGMQVLKPERLRNAIARRLQFASRFYPLNPEEKTSKTGN